MNQNVLKLLSKSYPLITRIKSIETLHRSLNGLNSIRFGSSASFETQPYVLYKLESGPSTKVSCNKEDALKFYKKMSLIRRCQQTAEKLYQLKKIRGFLHLYVGEEAICVGMHESLSPKDHVITAYRCHGWTYMMGVSIEGIMSELTGVRSGASRGKGGSMHMFAKNFYGGNGIVGAHVPVGTGVAFAQKYRNKDAVCFTLYGDGAANQGQVYEAFNMAKLWKIPVVYICENNLYGMGTTVERASANKNFHNRGLGVIPGVKADGMDVLCMREVAAWGKKYVLENGPVIIEVVTYRYYGHSMSDPGYSYRKREEIQDVRKTRDPIRTFKEKIIKANLVTEAELKALDDDNAKIVDAAVKVASTDKEVDEKEVAYDIYAKNIEGKIRNNLPWTGYEHKNLITPFNIK